MKNPCLNLKAMHKFCACLNDGDGHTLIVRQSQNWLNEREFDHFAKSAGGGEEFQHPHISEKPFRFVSYALYILLTMP